MTTYRDAAYAALREMDEYAETAGEDAHVGVLATRARLRADLDALDRAAAPTRLTHQAQAAADHPHGVHEMWRDDGKCLVKNCPVRRPYE